MRILITGGSGSVGGYTVPRLIEKGHEIKVLAVILGSGQVIPLIIKA